MLIAFLHHNSATVLRHISSGVVPVISNDIYSPQMSKVSFTFHWALSGLEDNKLPKFHGEKTKLLHLLQMISLAEYKSLPPKPIRKVSLCICHSPGGDLPSPPTTGFANIDAEEMWMSTNMLSICSTDTELKTRKWLLRQTRFWENECFVKHAGQALQMTKSDKLSHAS